MGTAGVDGTTAKRWQRRPPGSTWGDFGDDDELGRLNLVTARSVRLGLDEAREGLTFCLSLPLDYPGGNALNPRRLPPILRPTLHRQRPCLNYLLAADDPGATDVVNDDLAILHLQYSTHWDGLAHMGQLFDANGDGEAEAVFYNGYRAGNEISGSDDPADAGAAAEAPGESTTAIRTLGIQSIAAHGVQARGVMVDVRRHAGDASLVGYDRLMRILEADGVEVEEGDLVCIHTGFADLLLGMGRAPQTDVLHRTCAALDGHDGKLLDWITASGLAALVADNYAVEAITPRQHTGAHTILPLHEHCLFKLGVPLGELWYLTELAAWLHAHQRTRFLLTAPPLRLPGAIASPVTPIATV